MSTKIVIFSYPKLLSFSVLTFIKWRLTPSYAAKDTIFWQKRPKTIVIRIIVLNDNIQIYSYGLLCETINNMWFLAKEKMSMRGRNRTLTDSERKMNRSEVSSKWNKCRIYVGDQLDRWNDLKEVLRVQTRADFANILFDR